MFHHNATASLTALSLSLSLASVDTVLDDSVLYPRLMDSENVSNSSSLTEYSPWTPAAPSVSSPTSSQASSSSMSSPVGTQKRRAGRKKFRETRHLVYHGVGERNGGRWVCEVREPQKKNRIWLGTYATPEMAARAHDVAALSLRGKSAPLNFPDSAWAIPRARSTSVEDIRLAAAEAAEMFRPAWAATSTSVSPRPSRHHLTTEMPSAASEETEGGRVEAAEATGEMAAAAAEVAFVDEEALFSMPGLLAGMAEGMLLTPPAMQGKGFDWDDVDSYVDTSLWRR